MIAETIMTSTPVTVTERTSIGEALRRLSEEDIRHLPVVRNGDVIGMLSDRDFRNLGMTLVQTPEALDRLRGRLAQPVSELMSGGVVTVDRDAELSEIIELMLDEKLSAVPVVESGTRALVGLISYLDILKAVLPLVEED